MQFIINNKIYDTNTAEYIGTSSDYLLTYSISGLQINKPFEMYQTRKGGFFIVWTYNNHYRANVVDAEYIKKHIKDVDTYIKVFGEIEEG